MDVCLPSYDDEHKLQNIKEEPKPKKTRVGLIFFNLTP